MKNHVVRIFAIWALLICWGVTELSAQATRTTTSSPQGHHRGRANPAGKYGNCKPGYRKCD